MASRVNVWCCAYVVGEDEGEVELVRDSLGVSTGETGGSNGSTAESEHLQTE